jgi:hypothetical protein
MTSKEVMGTIEDLEPESILAMSRGALADEGRHWQRDAQTTIEDVKEHLKVHYQGAYRNIPIGRAAVVVDYTFDDNDSYFVSSSDE